MFERTYYATHPDMMECVSNEELRDRYLIQGLFRDGEVVLNYTHADRFVIGGVVVGGQPLRLPDQTEPASAAGKPFLERREKTHFIRVEPEEWDLALAELDRAGSR